MESIVKLVGEYGILTAIAIVFIWTTILDRKDKVQDKKDKKEEIEKNEKRDNKYNESLQLLSQSNDNIASALNLLKTSTDTNNCLLREHDERAIKIREDIIEIKTVVNNKPIKERKVK